MDSTDGRKGFVSGYQKMYDIMQIFTVLLDNKNDDESTPLRMSPSDYMQQMTLTTEERTAQLLKPNRSVELEPGSSVHLCPYFKAIPSIVIFQQYFPGKTYNVTLTIRNSTKASHYLKMSCERNPWFAIEMKGASYNTKIAPGMCMTYNVKFCPEERRDYRYSATFITESDTFTVPIIAIGPRPLLDFPDRIDVPQTAVKIASSKSLFVRNIGVVPAVFILSTESPFSIEPSKGILDEDETMQVTVSFKSAKKGDFKGDLLLTYQTGEVINLTLYGSAVNCNIRLDRGSIRLEDTFFGMSRSKTITIYNRSNYIVNFQWMMYKDSQTDMIVKEKYKKAFAVIKSLESVRCVDLEHYNICLPDAHELVCQRIYADELISLMAETFPFCHHNFALCLMEGEIWPHSSVDVTVIFEPDEIGEISVTAYLETSGREKRIPLNLHGLCIGPVFKLNMLSADVEFIFLCSVQHYEVVCANKGFIPGTLVYRKKPTDFGGKIEVHPPFLTLQPQEYKSFTLAFSSSHNGEFTERVDFVVKESLEVISLNIKGRIVCPTLHFDKPSLDFGMSPVGFPTKLDISLHNLSLVPVSFCLSMMNDGTQLSLTHDDFARSSVKPSLPTNPKEFYINPSAGMVAAHSFQKVKLTYTPNIVRTGQTAMRVDMWDSDSEPVTLPISFSSTVATLVVKPAEIIIRFCFINHPYKRSITVENKSDVEGLFYIAPQSVSAGTTMLYSLSTHQGYLKPNQTKSISLTIITTALGRQKAHLNMLVYGERCQINVCSLICNGQGPVVSVQPAQMNWGEVPVLQEMTDTLTIVSDSPIPSEFKITLKKRSPWSVNPTEGELEENQTVELVVTIFLRDCGKYSDKVLIAITNSRVIPVYMTAVGIGTSIVFHPTMLPVFDMGLLFSHQNIDVPVTMENKGSRHHELIWSPTPELHRLPKGVIQLPVYEKFSIEPLIVQVPANESVVIHCKIRWDVNETVTESWWLHGWLQGKREVLGTSTFTATFIEPDILFSKYELAFRADMHPSGYKMHLTEELLVTNKSRLKLSARLTVDPPFQIISEDDEEGEEYVQRATRILETDIDTPILVHFDFKPNESKSLYSRVYQGILKFEYEEHPTKNNIKCKAQVNYPNVTLIPAEIDCNCVLGCTDENQVILVNSGPIPVYFKFKWIDESVTISYSLPEIEIDETKPGTTVDLLDEESITSQLSSIDDPEESVEESHVESVLETPDTPPESVPILPSPAPTSPKSKKKKRKPGKQKSVEASLTKISSSPKIASTSDVKPEEVGTEVTMEEVKDCLFAIIEKYFVEDSEIPALEAVPFSPPFTERMWDILNIVPWEGLLLPYTSEYINFAFHGLEPMQLEATAICEVQGGPTEKVRVKATADAIHYFLDKRSIDFGQQLFCEVFSSTLTIINRGMVRFAYKTDTAEFPLGIIMEQTGESRLRVLPNCGVIEGNTSVELEITYYSGIPGPFREKMQLEIAHLTPVTIFVDGYGAFPQVYVCVPRENIFEVIPVELGYKAISAMTTRSLIKVQGLCFPACKFRSSEDDTRIPKPEKKRLRADGWEVISYGEIFPRVMDIEMAIERILTTQFIHQNLHVLVQHNTAMRKKAIPMLFTFDYVIDMEYVIVGQAAHYSAMLYNCGPTRAEISLKKLEKNDPMKKSDIIVQFQDRIRLPVGDFTTLHILFHPSRSRYPNRRTDIEFRIYLEVTHGCSLPIVIKGIVVYPFVTAHTKLLVFKDVAVGNCMQMPLLLTNEGLVSCEWVAEIMKRRYSRRDKQDDGPFYMEYTTDIFPPGHENVINVYFKPRKAGRWEDQIKIRVLQGFEVLTIMITGIGIEHRLEVIDQTISFLPVIPYTQFQEQTFTIENCGQYPLEFYWQHLNDGFLEEDRLIRVLAHYYGVSEILLPPRNPGEDLPAQISEFYQSLVREMACKIEARRVEEENQCNASMQTETMEGDFEESLLTVEEESNQETQERKSRLSSDEQRKSETKRRRSKRRGSKMRRLSDSDALKQCKSLRGFSELDLTGPTPPTPTEDPNEVETLLHCYIDDLRTKEDFEATMRDPVREIFEAADPKPPPVDHLLPKNKVCIIFHGAPFTEYQEAACRSARAIGCPVLNINNAILEIIALGNSACSIKLREIIDTNYADYLAKTERHRELLAHKRVMAESSNDPPQSPTSNEGSVSGTKLKGKKSPQTPKSAKSEKSTKSAKSEKSEKSRRSSSSKVAEKLEKPAMIRLYVEPDPFDEFKKIPPPEELENMDPRDAYEYKVQAILVLQKILTQPLASIPKEKVKTTASAKDKGSSKGSRKGPGENTFLGISSELIAEALRQRLSMIDYEAGFTLQTISNIFINEEVSMLLMLLRIIGNIKYFMFVSFYNTISIYCEQNDKLIKEQEEIKLANVMNKLEEIDAMSEEEFEVLSKEDKKLYAQKIVTTRKIAMSLRREAYMQRIAEAKKRKKAQYGRDAKNKKVLKTNKSKSMPGTSQGRIMKSNDAESKDTGKRHSSKGKETGGSRKGMSSKGSTKMSKKKEPLSKELQEISEQMDAYQESLAALQPILMNWDPIKGQYIDSVGRGKTPKSAKGKDRSSEPKAVNENKGFYTWYAVAKDFRSPEIYDSIVSQMAQNDLAKSALPVKIVEEPNLEPKLYSVVFQMPLETIPKVNEDVFTLASVLEIIPEETEPSHLSGSIDQNEMKSQTSPRGRSNESSTIGSISQTNSTTIPVSVVEVDEPLKPRCIMEPHAPQKFRIRFYPQKVGVYDQEYRVTIVGNNITYHILVYGTADIPRLNMDPMVIFSKVEETRVNHFNCPTFFLNTETLNFGPLVLLKNRDKRVHQIGTEFTFTNVSTINAEVFFFLMENNDLFEFYPESLYIAPGGTNTLALSAGVGKLGSNVGRLLLCVKNNPQVEIIQLESNGYKFDLELDGKLVTFDKILLFRKEKRTVIIRNNCSIPSYWSLDPLQTMDPQITFGPSSGHIKPYSENQIDFHYFANTVGVIEKNILTFKVVLEELDTEPLFVDQITITGETYDVLVDVSHANPIDLGYIKVGTVASQSFNIKNRGPYEIKFIIQMEQAEKLEKLNLEPKVREDFTIYPSTGALMPEKSMNVNVKFSPRNEMTITEAPLLKCHLVDTNKTISAVAEFPLTVSFISYYARFKVYPSPDVNFGACSVCIKQTMYLNIENSGKFPFGYTVTAPESAPAGASPTARSKKDKKDKEKKDSGGDEPTSKKERRSPKTAKTPKSFDAPCLRVGPFTLVKFAGEVEAGQVATLAIDLYPEGEGLFENEIIVRVSDSAPENTGHKITLLATGCIPQIDCHDLNTIFQENFIVDRIQDFSSGKELGGHTIFARQEKCLYFRRVGVLNTHTAYFKLYNPDLICADVVIAFQANKSTPISAKLDTFVVEPRWEKIPALSSKEYTVSFTPELIETYTAVFDVVVEVPPSFKRPWLTIKLSGEGCVPEVCLIEPSIRGNNGEIIMNFGRNLLGEVGYKTLSLKNIGSIRAKVIVEVYHDANFLFSLEALENTKQSIHIWNCDAPNDRSTICHLSPEEVSHFNVKFTPNEVGKFNGLVRLFIVDNPYEAIAVELQGEGYVETVVLEGLELTDFVPLQVSAGKKPSVSESLQKARRSIRPSSKSVSPQSEPSVSVTSYKLDHGLCFLNKMKRITFKITNRSNDQYFRFEWTSHPNVVFTPSIGHLKEYGSKDITATFLATNPMTHTQTHLECKICEISFSSLPEDMFWDDRQTNVRWEEVKANNEDGQEVKEPVIKKIVEPVPEPEHEVIPGTMKVLQIIFCVVAAYSEYRCSVTEINFKDTLMFQTCEYTFLLENPGSVNLEYTWSLSIDEQFPVRLSNTALQAVLKSLEAVSRGSCPSTRASNNTLYPHSYRPVCKPIPSNEKTIDVEPGVCRMGTKSDLFSSTAALTNRSTDSWVEGDYLPFKIIPESGTLLPGETANCTLKFSPLDVFDYKSFLLCKMENLNPELPPLNISVTARSLLPYCHFDVPESDYLSSGKRDPKLPGPLGTGFGCPLPDNVRVIEFKIMGVGQTHVKKFFMINPTAEDYYFSWHDGSVESAEEVSYFHCMVMEGIAERGKQTELAFTFLAQDVGTFESFWIFSIKKYELETLFLFVGIVTEPSVYNLTVHLKMKPTLMGMKVSDSITLVNNESFQLPFRVLPDSLYSEGRLQCLIVQPMSGILQPHSEQLLRVEFQPAFSGESAFSIQCRVKKMKNPLVTFVSTMVFSIKPFITYKNKEKSTVQIQHDKDNVIDFGNIIPRKAYTLNFQITNTGKTTFYYKWDVGMDPELVSKNYYAVTMQQKQGHITSQSRSTCPLALTVFRKTQIHDHRVTIKINRGPEYHIIIKASAQKPSYIFGFTEYNFGPSYIQRDRTACYRIAIHFTNFEETPCVMDCKFENVPHFILNCDHLSEAVPGYSSIKIPVEFRPLERECYHEVVTFVINSTMEFKTTFLGEGITYKVCLVNPKHKSVNLGHLPLGKSVTRRIPIVNKGRAPILIKVDIMKNLSAYEEHHCQLEPCTFESVAGKGSASVHLDRSTITKMQESCSQRNALTIKPSEPVNLMPNMEIDIVLTFNPTERLGALNEKIAVQMHSTLVPLSIVKGSCIAAEFFLNRAFLPFGTVIDGCSSEIKLMLMNTGDMGAKFRWITTKLQPNFDIEPLAGYCSPGMDVTFIATFHPVQPSDTIQGEAIVEIENYKSLTLTMAGGCCKLPDPTETLSFTTHVRKPVTKNMSITNNTSQTWQLQPIITGDYFYTELEFTVLPKQANSCVITYHPLTMTTENNPHKGTVFFKLPEGKALLYALVGVNSPPETLAKIVREFPAKTRYTELLPVYNWLSQRQKFACKIELTNELKGNPVYTFTGNKALDIPPDVQRDYRAIFHSYKDANFNFKVKFINDEGEYQHYELLYKVTKPEILDSIKLMTTVRSPVCHILKLENPLTSQQIIYTANCSHQNITIYGFPKMVKPESYEKVKIEFYPMVETESVVRLDVTCPELGVFPYELRLKANPTAPEKPTHVTAVLGSSTIFSLVIKNCSKNNADFALKVDNSSLSCEKSISVVGLKEGTTNVVYEPCNIENVAATLTAFSEIAGKYVFPIIGTFAMPKPQGPFTLKQGTSITIPFKNVFKESKTFNFSVDVPTAFHVKNQTEIVKSKRTVNIIVGLLSRRSMENVIENNFPITGKLVVCCSDTELSHVKWIYYLRGVLE